MRQGQDALATQRGAMKAVMRLVFVSIISMSVAIAIAWGAAGGYARADLLAETDWLAQHLNDPGIRIVDMRSEGAYQKGHILGAVLLGWKALKDADNGRRKTIVNAAVRYRQETREPPPGTTRSTESRNQ